MARKINGKQLKTKPPPLAPPPSSEPEQSEVQAEEVRSSLELETESVDPFAHLPPHIVTNPRLKIEPEFIPQETMVKSVKKKKVEKVTALIWTERTAPKVPIPKHPISLSWWPIELYFSLGQSAAVTKSLRITNRSPNIIYIHCCGLWNETARMGASWKCYPRTRILLAPGLNAEMYIQAKPHEESPVPVAFAGLQLATAHREDTVFGYFVVPINVSFYNYVSPENVECEGEIH